MNEVNIVLLNAECKYDSSILTLIGVGFLGVRLVVVVGGVVKSTTRLKPVRVKLVTLDLVHRCTNIRSFRKNRFQYQHLYNFVHSAYFLQKSALF